MLSIDIDDNIKSSAVRLIADPFNAAVGSVDGYEYHDNRAEAGKIVEVVRRLTASRLVRHEKDTEGWIALLRLICSLTETYNRRTS